MKRNILFLVIGFILASGISAVAYSYTAKQVSFTPNDKSWNVSTVEEALTDLKESNGGYVALFTGSSSISNTGAAIPINYSNEKYVSQNGDYLTINISGEYQIIGTIGHSSSCECNAGTSWLNVIINNKVYKPSDYDWSAHQNFLGDYLLNSKLVLNKGDIINVKIYSDQSKTGIRRGTVVLIKL